MKIKILLSLLTLALCSQAEEWAFQLGGLRRVVEVTAPAGISNPPLVIAMHGMNGWHRGYQNDTKWDAIADREKFIVVYPNSDGGRWDLGGNKDLDFLNAIIDSAHRRYSIDLARVFSTGWSMGGMMSYYLACKQPNRVTAIGPASGYPMGGQSGCDQSRPVPIFHIHGTADDVVVYPNLHPFLRNKVTEYGCPTNPETTRPYPANRTSNTYKEYWGPCTNSRGLTSSISVITIANMGHWYATDYNGNNVHESEEFWSFFKTQSMTPPVVVPPNRDSVFNGDFSQGTAGWTLNIWDGTATGSVTNEEYVLNVQTAGSEAYQIQLIQAGIILENGQSYEISFEAQAPAPRTLQLNVERDVDPWTSYLPELQNFSISTTKTSYSYIFTMTNPTDSSSRISFNAGMATGEVRLDNITIRQASAPVHVFSHKGNRTAAPTMQWFGVTVEQLHNLNSGNGGPYQIFNSRGAAVPYSNTLPQGIYHLQTLPNPQ